MTNKFQSLCLPVDVNKSDNNTTDVRCFFAYLFSRSWLCVYVCMYVCVYVCMCVCVCVCVCMYVCVCLRIVCFCLFHYNDLLIHSSHNNQNTQTLERSAPSFSSSSSSSSSSSFPSSSPCASLKHYLSSLASLSISSVLSLDPRLLVLYRLRQMMGFVFSAAAERELRYVLLRHRDRSLSASTGRRV